jgi:tryptophan synthase beta subunit
VLVNMSGRGDKDVEQAMELIGADLGAGATG